LREKRNGVFPRDWVWWGPLSKKTKKGKKSKKKHFLVYEETKKLKGGKEQGVLEEHRSGRMGGPGDEKGGIGTAPSFKERKGRLGRWQNETICP